LEVLLHENGTRNTCSIWVKQDDIDAAKTIAPADNACYADTPAAVMRPPSPVVAETERQGDDACYADTPPAAVRPPSPVVAETERSGDDTCYADTRGAVVRPPSPVVAKTERSGDAAGNADTPAAAVVTTTPVERELLPRTPDHNKPRFRSVRPGEGVVIATLNQLMGMVRSLQADNRQLRQLVQANNRQATDLHRGSRHTETNDDHVLGQSGGNSANTRRTHAYTS